MARAASGHCALVLGWTPDVFWNATPDELAAVIEARLASEILGVSGSEGVGGGIYAGGLFAAPPPSRADLMRMMESYPDGL